MRHTTVTAARRRVVAIRPTEPSTHHATLSSLPRRHAHRPTTRI